MRHMVRRVLAAIFWFVAVSAWYGFAAFAFGLPEAAGPVVAIVVAAFVAVDPAHLIWQTRRVPR
jgi:hypothetical protein